MVNVAFTMRRRWQQWEREGEELAVKVKMLLEVGGWGEVKLEGDNPGTSLLLLHFSCSTLPLTIHSTGRDKHNTPTPRFATNLVKVLVAETFFSLEVLESFQRQQNLETQTEGEGMGKGLFQPKVGGQLTAGDQRVLEDHVDTLLVDIAVVVVGAISCTLGTLHLGPLQDRRMDILLYLTCLTC